MPRLVGSSSRLDLVLLALFGLAAPACVDGDDSDALPPVIRAQAPAQALCTALVDGRGEIDMETDYLPHVVQCENGGADFEALKAQAIAARSVAYATILTHGSICDSQQCQVYSCGAEPSEQTRRAVAETAGQYLSYGGVLTYGFYVSGDKHTAAPSCEGNPAVPLESRVTYNEGLFGTDVEQTTLGFVFDPGDAGYGQNRGCMSQWGARCLDAQGHDAADILRFYYGADIEIRAATGSCAAPPDPTPPQEPDPTPPDPTPPQEPEPTPPDPTPPDPTPPDPPLPDPGMCGALLPGGSLGPDQGLTSCDGRFTLVAQTDGNLVLYQADVGALWDTQTFGNTMGGLWMQEDGNLVVYDANGTPLWHTSTNGQSGSWLAVQDDGNVVLYRGGEALWNSGTCCR